jgi:hypothetical protein
VSDESYDQAEARIRAQGDAIIARAREKYGDGPPDDHAEFEAVIVRYTLPALRKSAERRRAVGIPCS